MEAKESFPQIMRLLNQILQKQKDEKRRRAKIKKSIGVICFIVIGVIFGFRDH